MLQISGDNALTSDLTDQFAASLGLPSAPALSDVIISDSAPIVKQKKTSKLERLKLKILEKRQKQQDNLGGDDDWIPSDSDTEKKRASKMEKRQQRLRELRNTDNVATADPTEDVLEVVGCSTGQIHEEAPVIGLNPAEIQKKVRKQRIKIRADGTAKIKGLAALHRDDPTHHVFFDDDDEEPKQRSEYVSILVMIIIFESDHSMFIIFESDSNSSSRS